MKPCLFLVIPVRQDVTEGGKSISRNRQYHYEWPPKLFPRLAIAGIPGVDVSVPKSARADR